jgi:hypothetical protein
MGSIDGELADGPGITIDADRHVELRLGDIDADAQRCSLHQLLS